VSAWVNIWVVTLAGGQRERHKMITWVIDSDHAWLAVSVEAYPDAVEYGTGFGFVDSQSGVIYLEEDCEALGFLRAHPEIDPSNLPEQGREGYAPCRMLPNNEAIFDVNTLYKTA
jgi:hypothetical protein